jgi:hypothetical protein
LQLFKCCLEFLVFWKFGHIQWINPLCFPSLRLTELFVFFPRQLYQLLSSQEYFKEVCVHLWETYHYLTFSNSFCWAYHEIASNLLHQTTNHQRHQKGNHHLLPKMEPQIEHSFPSCTCYLQKMLTCLWKIQGHKYLKSIWNKLNIEELCLIEDNHKLAWIQLIDFFL